MSDATIDYIAVPAFQDNYIWVLANDRDAVVVDPGDAAPVAAWLRTSGRRLAAILLTHHHPDHTGGVADLLDEFARDHRVPVYGPVAESIPTVSQPVTGGDRVTIDALGVTFEVLDIPGHTRGHIAFFLADAGSAPPRVFCGDTLFASGCGRLFEGTAAQMLASLDALARLPDDTLMHCGHEYTLSNLRFATACEPDNGDVASWLARAAALRARGEPTLPTAIGHEKRVNPFLRVGAPAVRHAAEAQTGNTLNDRLAVFTALRSWKDSFR